MGNINIYFLGGRCHKINRVSKPIAVYLAVASGPFLGNLSTVDLPLHSRNPQRITNNHFGGHPQRITNNHAWENQSN